MNSPAARQHEPSVNAADDNSTSAAVRRVRILALTRKSHSASFEQRVLKYIQPLAGRGVDVSWQRVPKTGRERRALRKTLGDHDGIWWHRYLIAPYMLGPWRRAARKIIFDFDDPLIYSTRSSGRRANMTRLIKFRWLLGRCDAAFAGSEHLAEHARRYCRAVFVVPMGVDLPPEPTPRVGQAGEAELLWLGGRATMKYLRPLLPALEKLAAQQPGVKLRLVAHEPLPAETLRVDFRPWSPEQQAVALRECDIGLCPMPDTPWTRGKCPYKVLQYMAHGMPWVGSAIGANPANAGRPGSAEQRGLCADGEEEWIAAVGSLVDNVELRRRLGSQGRRYVEGAHGREAMADRLAALLREITASRADEPE